RAEADPVGAQALVEMQKVAFVVFGREDLLRAGVRQQAGQQIVVGRRGPGSIGPPLFDGAKLLDCLRTRFDERVVAAAIEDDDDVVVRLRSPRLGFHRGEWCPERAGSGPRHMVANQIESTIKDASNDVLYDVSGSGGGSAGRKPHNPQS